MDLKLELKGFLIFKIQKMRFREENKDLIKVRQLVEVGLEKFRLFDF